MNKKYRKAVVFLILFCLCMGAVSMVSAKYLKEIVTKNNSVTAKEFYFESDLLDGKTHKVSPTDNGTAKVTVRLKNYADELRYSETAIDYEVTVKESGSDTAAGGVTIDPPTGILTAESKRYADIVISGLQPGITYTVTATTSNSYHKTLTGTIEVAAIDRNVHASINDQTQYIEVTVWTTDYSGSITLKYDGNIGLSPDNTDTLMSQNKTGDLITIDSWKANTSHVFRFFKDNTNESYEVTENGTEVTVSAK